MKICHFSFPLKRNPGDEVEDLLLKYKYRSIGATIGVKKLQEELRSKRIDAINGQNGGATWGAEK